MKNPIEKSDLFSTPYNLDELSAWINELDDNPRRVAALAAAGMATNLAHKQVEAALEAAKAQANAIGTEQELAALARQCEVWTLTCADLDELVYETAAGSAAEANNGGLQAQITFLNRNCGIPLEELHGILENL